MAQRCKVCSHPEAKLIDAHLAAGAQIKPLARQYGVTHWTLLRHREQHAHVLRVVRPPKPKLVKPPLKINRNPALPPPTPEVELTAKEEFLKEYADHGDFTGSAAIAGVSRATIQVWLEHDEEFTLRFHQAKAAVVDQLEATALDRAMHGAKLIREVWRGDRLIERVIEWRPQETTLVKLLQALKPEVYGEKLQVTQTQIVKTVDEDAWVAV